jgi:hypothetical protein
MRVIIGTPGPLGPSGERGFPGIDFLHRENRTVIHTQL